MKNISKIIFFALALSVVGAIAQNNKSMLVFQGNSFTEFATENVDSISPKLGSIAELDSLFFFKSDIITHRFRVEDVDSIVFRTQAEMLKNDSLALVALFNATDGENWTNKDNWLSDRPIREWHGVGFCWSLQRVTGLWLWSNNLTGVIPSEIGQLTQLQFLFLSDNKITSIPAEIGRLTQLRTLELGLNNLTTAIPPEIGQLEQLRYLGLALLNLTAIPAEIGQLTQLTTLDLALNNLTEIPDGLASGLISLESLILFGNRFSGAIPAQLVERPNFESLIWQFFPQQEGYGFDRLNPPLRLENRDLINQEGDIINAHAFFSNHQLTILYDWAIWCPFSTGKVPVIRELYENYQDRGLGVLSFVFSCSSAPEADIEKINAFRTERGMTWNNFLMSLESSQDNRIPRYSSTRHQIFPTIHVVNHRAEVLYSTSLWDQGHQAIGIAEFIASILGEIDPGDLYESTDFSMDGEVLVLQSATVGQGVNFILVGDGFVDRDMGADGRYEQVMREAMEHIFSVEPMKSYREFFNVFAVKAVSKNEGIGAPRQTVFSSEFGRGTWVRGNHLAVLSYADKVQGIDLTNSPIMVVLNSPAFAGTAFTWQDGTSISYVPIAGFDSDLFAGLIHHELLGHSFGRFLDEYILYNATITPEYITQFNEARTYFNMGFNLSLDPTDVPWQHFIGLPGYEMVGMYEGGFFFTEGVWRSEQNSVMNDNMPYFNAIQRELIVRRILETAGITFCFEKFLERDRIVPVSDTLRLRRDREGFAPSTPPVLIRGNAR